VNPGKLHRFFVSHQAIHDDVVAFPTEIARQIVRVLRLRAGDQVIVLDGSGHELTVRLTIDGQAVVGQIQSHRPSHAEPEVRVMLYQGMLKGSKFEIVVQHCTEVGVSNVTPIISEHSVSIQPSDARQRRFAVIAREAAEQCRRGLVPSIGQPQQFTDAVALAARAGPVIMLWEDEQAQHVRDVQLPLDMRQVALFVGPEGGFSAREVDHVRHHGGHLATLGPRTLRAETAAIVATALLLARFDTLAEDGAIGGCSHAGD